MLSSGRNLERSKKGNYELRRILDPVSVSYLPHRTRSVRFDHPSLVAGDVIVLSY